MPSLDGLLGHPFAGDVGATRADTKAMAKRLAPLDFVGGVAVLAVLSATISAVPPALFAATRDPVAVLRTP